MSVAHNQLRIARELWGRLQPLDRHVPVRLQSLLADRRFGSRDRRLYRELLFTALRHARVLATLPATDEVTWAALLAASCAGTRETEAFCAAFAAPGHPVPATSPLDLVPAWFAAEVETGSGLPAPAELAAGLLARAPVWVRQQSPTPDAAIAEWAARGWAAQVHPEVPDAFRLPPEASLSACSAYQSGHYEIQDLGSQLVLASLDLPVTSPGTRWLDACAGAGGKTIQLARLLGPSARIEAADPRPAALAELQARAARAGLGARIRLAPHSLPSIAPSTGGNYDGVLVDAPCTGTGTWRRSPHLMACTRPSDLAEAAVRQLEILTKAAARVRVGGLLVYATCSVMSGENEGLASAFLANVHDKFSSVPPARTFGFPCLTYGLAIIPGRHDNDGFYVACFRRTK